MSVQVSVEGTIATPRLLAPTPWDPSLAPAALPMLGMASPANVPSLASFSFYNIELSNLLDVPPSLSFSLSRSLSLLLFFFFFSFN